MARRFDGTDDYGIASALSGAMPSGPMTLGYWQRVPVSDAEGMALQLISGDGDGIGAQYRFAGAEYIMRGYSAISEGGEIAGTEVGSGHGVTVDLWELVFLESDEDTPDHGWFVGSSAKGSRYTGAALRGTGSGTLLLAAQNIVTPTSFGQVDIAEVFICDYFLSSQEKSDLAGGDSPSSLSTPPLYHWQLKGDASPEPEVNGGTAITIDGATQTTHPTVDDPPGGDPPGGSVTRRIIAVVGA